MTKDRHIENILAISYENRDLLQENADLRNSLIKAYNSFLTEFLSYLEENPHMKIYFKTELEILKNLL